MSNNKQSSVDKLCQKLANKLGLQAITFYIDHAEEIAEAKAMHKEEIVDSIVQYQINHYHTFTEQEILNTVKKAETYYNETFGGNNGQQ